MKRAPERSVSSTMKSSRRANAIKPLNTTAATTTTTQASTTSNALSCLTTSTGANDNRRHFTSNTNSIKTKITRQTWPLMSLININFIVIVVMMICVQGINCFQRFSEQPKYTEVNPGQDALLTCKVIDKRGTCSWQKDNKPVGIYAKKYEWAARSSSSGSGNNLHLDLHPPPMQIGGDCSLWIRSATLDFDDGFWECQVTASDFTTLDALTSQPVRLVVRVTPQRPRLEFASAHVPPGHNITVDAGATATVRCVSHYGNPPASLKWYLGDQELTPTEPQENNTEPDNPRTWSASSVVMVKAMRERHGDLLRCLAFHESYTAKSVPVEARFDVRYAPTIRLIGSPEIDLEEDKDALVLRCVADANPPASVVWRRAGRSEIASLQETLQLRPVSRRDAGLYTCQAQNSVGTSEQLSVQLDVKYPPKIISAGPDRLTTAPLFSPAAFECVADGNPMPSYKWVQRIAHGSKFVERGNEPRLVIDNVTYDYQGEYECRATSHINGQERTVVSDPINLQVVGAPQVLRLHPSLHTVSVKRGEPATMSLVVCADPRPHRVAWEWGSLRLEAGSGTDRFHVDDVLQDPREDCYLSTLHISRTDEHDSRPYYLVVENERGTDRHAIHLNVEEPLEISYLMGIAGGCLAAIFILICLCLYAVRGKKCCFKGSSGYKSSDKDSEKADLKSRSDSTSGPQGDSIYTTPAGFHHQHQQHLSHAGHGSPEAMKAAPPAATTTSATTATATVRALDGNLLWQQEAAEFIERFPQRRRPHAALRPSASAGALGKSTTTSFASVAKRASGGELLTTQQRHQRDLFSGDLGIPEIRTHVGSVVHSFETMALQRQLAEQERERERERMVRELATPQRHQQPPQQQLPLQSHSKYAPVCAMAKTIFVAPIARASPHHSTRNGNSNSNKYNQLKRKAHEARHKLLQLSQQQLLAHSNNDIQQGHQQLLTPTLPSQANKLTNSCSTQTLPTLQAPGEDADCEANRRSTVSLHRPAEQPSYEAARESNGNIASQYGNMAEDYRKNLFGTIPSRKCHSMNCVENHNSAASHRQPATYNSPQHDANGYGKRNVNNSHQEEDFIVNEAFDEIFAGYSGVDDDDEEDAEDRTNGDSLMRGYDENLVSLSELDDDVFKSLSSSRINNLGCPGNTPKKLTTLTPATTHKKLPPPPLPPAPSTAANNNNGYPSSELRPTTASTSSDRAEAAPKKKRIIAPLALHKQRSTTLANLFERLKTTKTKRTLNKTPSDSLLEQDQLSIAQATQAPTLHKCTPQMDLYREVEGEEGNSNSNVDRPATATPADGDFMRGSTLSQSFVRHLKMHRSDRTMGKQQQKPPAPMPPTSTAAQATTTTTAAAAAILKTASHHPIERRTRSSNELILSELAMQTRRYRRSASRSQVRQLRGYGVGAAAVERSGQQNKVMQQQNSAEI